MAGTFVGYLPWEAGGGRVPRQPGQVRKEAALTSKMRVVVQSLICARIEAVGERAIVLDVMPAEAGTQVTYPPEPPGVPYACRQLRQ
jgi:hypothetical protein